ncbi:3-oxoacyl-[acyl-carrier-protein] reductase [Tindallia californiensis]|nr:3-oxoacyl-[acyl-carrier-protein] reductase [Tindallia californiensis]
MLLEKKIVLITGASRGIGRSIALKMASQGAKVVVNYARQESAAQEVVKEIESSGGQAIAVKADVSNEQQVLEMVKNIKDTLGPIDILINNAGITRDGLLLRMKYEDWQEVMDINLTGTFLCSKAVLRDMIKSKKGTIVNLSSIVGLSGNAGQCNYSASKAGVIGFTKSLAKEVAGKGITVNAIAPGFIETEMTDALSEKVKDQLLKEIPLQSLGKSEDIAEAALFLASDSSRYITGQVLQVDGGMGI